MSPQMQLDDQSIRPMVSGLSDGLTQSILALADGAMDEPADIKSRRFLVGRESPCSSVVWLHCANNDPDSECMTIHQTEGPLCQFD